MRQNVNKWGLWMKEFFLLFLQVLSLKLFKIKIPPSPQKESLYFNNWWNNRPRQWSSRNVKTATQKTNRTFIMDHSNRINWWNLTKLKTGQPDNAACDTTGWMPINYSWGGEKNLKLAKFLDLPVYRNCGEDKQIDTINTLLAGSILWGFCG